MILPSIRDLEIVPLSETTCSIVILEIEIIFKLATIYMTVKIVVFLTPLQSVLGFHFRSGSQISVFYLPLDLPY
jgi:hypothetical protein